MSSSLYAVVDTTTNTVVQTILWDNTSPWMAGANSLLVPLTEGSACGIDWVHNPEDNTFSNPNPPATVEEAKQYKFSEVDSNTESLIEGGFYHNGIRFGCSIVDQMNWRTSYDYRALIGYPQTAKGWNVEDIITIPNEQEHIGYVTAALNHVLVTRTSGWALKTQINTLESIEDIMAFTDPRV